MTKAVRMKKSGKTGSTALGSNGEMSDQQGASSKKLAAAASFKIAVAAGLLGVGLWSNQEVSAHTFEGQAPNGSQGLYGNGSWQPAYNGLAYGLPTYGGYTTSYAIGTTDTTTSTVYATTTTSTEVSYDSSFTIPTYTNTETNTYPMGQCTWAVKVLAPWVGDYWGNAADWVASAQAAGYQVGTTPQEGAIAVWFDGGYGHVAYVVDVQSDTAIQVLESNYNGNMQIGNYRGVFNPTDAAYGYSVMYIYPAS